MGESSQIPLGNIAVADDKWTIQADNLCDFVVEHTFDTSCRWSRKVKCIKFFAEALEGNHSVCRI